MNPRDTDPVFSGESDNILTNFAFTFDNFARILGSDGFWHVLRVPLYCTVFGTLGALVLGLIAVQLLDTTFKGRGVLRGLFLFPYVAPVTAFACA